MFGYLFKKRKKNTPEIVEIVQEINNITVKSSENNIIPEIQYYEVKSYANLKEYLDNIIAIQNQMYSNENQFNFAKKINDFQLMYATIKNWLKDIEKYKNQINELGSFNGNDFLLEKTMLSFKERENWVGNYFTLLAESIEEKAPNIKNIEQKIEEERVNIHNKFNADLETFKSYFNKI